MSDQIVSDPLDLQNRSFDELAALLWAAGPDGTVELQDGRTADRYVVPDALYIEDLGDVARLVHELAGGDATPTALDWTEQHRGHDECSPPLWPNHPAGATWFDGSWPDAVRMVADCRVVEIQQHAFVVVYSVANTREAVDQ